TALKQRGLEAELARIAGPRLAPDEAVAQLFKSRVPDRRVPDAPDAMRAALLDSEPIPPTATSELAGQRVETVRAVAKRAGIDAARLPQKSEVVDAERDVDGQVTLDLVTPESPRRPAQRREFLGTPIPGFRSP